MSLNYGWHEKVKAVCEPTLTDLWERGWRENFRIWKACVSGGRGLYRERWREERARERKTEVESPSSILILENPKIRLLKDYVLRSM